MLRLLEADTSALAFALEGDEVSDLETALTGNDEVSGMEVAMVEPEDSRGQDFIQQRTLTQTKEATATKVTRAQEGIRRKLAA